MTSEKYIVCWSGGKDSTATIILAHEKNLPIEQIIINLIWFDKERKIYADHPEVIEWIFDYAIPLFSSWGYSVKILESEKDYVYWFYHKLEKSSKAERIGKRAGWLLRGACAMNREKTRPVEKYVKSLGSEYKQYIGIAADEPERLVRAHEKGNLSLLEKFNYTELDAYELCKKYGLLSPTYSFSSRSGCWFCPNQKIKELAHTKIEHPELWDELLKLDAVEGKISECFKHDKTFKQIAAEVDAYIADPPAVQLSLFDYV